MVFEFVNDALSKLDPKSKEFIQLKEAILHHLSELVITISKNEY